MLSNDQLRAAYDKDGEEAVSANDTAFVDPAMFFNMLFGSERFQPYVGRLKLGHMASAFGDALKLASASGEEGEKEGQAGQQEQQSGPEDVFGAHFQGDRAARVQNLREVRLWCYGDGRIASLGALAPAGRRPAPPCLSHSLTNMHMHIHVHRSASRHTWPRRCWPRSCRETGRGSTPG